MGQALSEDGSTELVSGVPSGANVQVERLHTAVPGRARLKVRGLARNEALKARLEHGLVNNPYVYEVQANAWTGNLILRFTRTYPLEPLVAQIERIVFDANREPRQPLRAQLPQANSAGSAASDSRSFQGATAKKKRKLRTRQEISPPPFSDGGAWHACSTAQVLERLQTSVETGLSQEAAQERLMCYGANVLPRAAGRSDLSMLAEQFMSAPVAMLGISAAVSILTGGLVDALVIGAVVFINAAIGYTTERQAERTIAELTDHKTKSVTVIREGTRQEQSSEETVPGDLLVLMPGMTMPADARLIRAKRLTMDEAALTGESMPVAKEAEALLSAETPLAERHNMAYMGTVVTGGSGRAVVVGTGRHTEIGTIQALVGETRPPETPMQQQLDRMGTQLALLSSAVCAGVFVLGVLRGYGWLEMLKASISLAVAAVPEGLPAIGTSTLALGIRKMRHKQVLIRHLDAVETLGALQVLCFDKTGTLTLNHMQVSQICSGEVRIKVEEGRFFAGGQEIDPQGREELTRLLQAVSLCSESELAGTEGDRQIFQGSPTENALVEAASSAGLNIAELRRAYPRLHVQYRSEGRPYMKTVHRLHDERCLLAVKGSPSEVVKLCDRYMRDGEIRALREAERNAIFKENERMAGDALRVLGVAYREQSGEEMSGGELVWLGLMGMADPIRPAMKPLMQSFHRAGIRTAMITGDQSSTAYAIGRALELNDDGDVEILDSSSLQKVDPDLLASLAQRVHVFSRVSPAQKLEIVQALQRAGQVVAMTGDGVNDGPALKAANIGVAMGGAGGSDVARSVADVVLEDDNLQTMIVAVRQGRSIYENIRKGIRFLLATNFSEIEVMLVAVTLGLPQPLNPMQLLWINLITDIFPGIALSLDPPEPDILNRPPRNPNEPIIRNRDLKVLGTQSAIISTGALASMGYALLRYGPGPQANTQLFTTLTVGQLLHALGCRSEQHSIFRPNSTSRNPYLSLAIGASLAAQGLTLLVPGLRSLLGTVPLGLVDALVVGAGSGLPLLVNESMKSVPHPKGSLES